MYVYIHIYTHTLKDPTSFCPFTYKIFLVEILLLRMFSKFDEEKRVDPNSLSPFSV